MCSAIFVVSLLPISPSLVLLLQCNLSIASSASLKTFNSCFLLFFSHNIIDVFAWLTSLGVLIFLCGTCILEKWYPQGCSIEYIIRTFCYGCFLKDWLNMRVLKGGIYRQLCFIIFFLQTLVYTKLSSPCLDKFIMFQIFSFSKCWSTESDYRASENFCIWWVSF